MTPEPRAEARTHLRLALDTLTTIRAVADDVGADGFAVGTAVRQQLRYLWIVVGSRLKEHARALGRTRAESGFAAAIRFRDKLAYSSPGSIVDTGENAHRPRPADAGGPSLTGR